MGHEFIFSRSPTHPGEMLKEEFLIPLGLTQVAFAHHLGIPIQRLNEIVCGKRGISADTAWLFSQALGTSPHFWLSLQSVFDLAKTASSVRKIPCVNKSLLVE